MSFCNEIATNYDSFIQEIIYYFINKNPQKIELIVRDLNKNNKKKTFLMISFKPKERNLPKYIRKEEEINRNKELGLIFKRFLIQIRKSTNYQNKK